MMRNAIIALPVAIGIAAGALDTDDPAITVTVLSDEDLLVLESTDVSWPDHDPSDPAPHFVFGIPEFDGHDDDHNLIREYEGFTIYWDDEVLGPRWTAIKLTAEMADANGDFDRLSRFKKDNVIEDAGLEVTVHDDYKNRSGSRKWSRGHMVQFDDARGWGDTAGEESFFTSNITPQLQDHNAKGWLSLEKTCTEFARDYGVVWIYSGPIYDDELKPFERGRTVPAPIAFYKIAVSPGEGGSVDVVAFRMPHEPIDADADLSDFLVSIDDIEVETGIDFLHALPDVMEDIIESEVWEIWPDVEDED